MSAARSPAKSLGSINSPLAAVKIAAAMRSQNVTCLATSPVMSAVLSSRASSNAAWAASLPSISRTFNSSSAVLSPI